MGLRRGMAGLAAAVCAGIALTSSAAAQVPADSTSRSPNLADFARQSQMDAPVALDTLIQESHIGIRFMPKYTNKINGDVNAVSMFNGFDTNVTTGFGSFFNFTLSAEEKYYRTTVNKRDENKYLSLSMAHTFDVFTSGSLSFVDKRVFNRSIASGGRTEDFIFNDQSVNAGTTYKRAIDRHTGFLRKFRVDAMATGAVVQSEKTYKDDQTLAAGGFGGFATNLMQRRVHFVGRGGRRQTWDRSRTSLAEFDDLGSFEDSLSTGLMAEVGDSIFVDAGYVYYEAERSWADQQRASLGGQQQGEEYVFQEQERRSARSLVMSLNAKVLRAFNVKVSAFHDTQLYDNATQKDRNSNTIGDGLRGAFAYVTPWKTAATVSLENTKTLRDLGPTSISSQWDIRKKASLSLSHILRPGLSFDLAGTTQLARSEYLDPVANPRDRDQLDTSVNLTILSKPFTDVTAKVSVAYSASEFINIRATQSGENRTRELYELRPSFTYKVSERFTIAQLYGIQIEYTDYIYKPTQNFLDRNLTFGNTFYFAPMRNVDFLFDYALNAHDDGSYLPDPITGDEELIVQGEDRRHRFTLRMDYGVLSKTRQVQGQEISSRLNVFAENLYSRFEDTSVLSGRTTSTSDGQIKVGTSGEYKWGNGRALTFRLARVKKFGRFGTDVEKNFWDMYSEFSYPF